MRIWSLRLRGTSKRSLTCRKMLRRGAFDFASHSKEDVLRIFVALTNPSPWPCSNPRTLRPVTITPTTTPPRWLSNGMFCVSYCTPLKVTVVPLLSELATTDTNRSVKKQEIFSYKKQRVFSSWQCIFVYVGRLCTFCDEVKHLAMTLQSGD
jgi:hypothetical protein